MITKDLYDKYPRLFKNCYISVEEGWLPIVADLAEKVEAAFQSLSQEEQETAEKKGSYVFCQIKEKFGGLRAYLDGCPEELHKAASEAEEACWKICETCGDPATTSTDMSWIKTLCEAHHKARALYKKLRNYRCEFDKVFSKETAVPRINTQIELGAIKDTKSAGHCAVVAAFLHNHLGGDLVSSTFVRESSKGPISVSHWFNFIGSKYVDLTADQFGETRIKIWDPEVINIRVRKRAELNRETLQRLEIFEGKYKLLNG